MITLMILEENSSALARNGKHGFKGVFFVMTVAINRPNYLSSDEIKN
jgi:hypothetical protein